MTSRMKQLNDTKKVNTIRREQSRKRSHNIFWRLFEIF